MSISREATPASDVSSNVSKSGHPRKRRKCAQLAKLETVLKALNSNNTSDAPLSDPGTSKNWKNPFLGDHTSASSLPLPQGLTPRRSSSSPSLRKIPPPPPSDLSDSEDSPNPADRSSGPQSFDFSTPSPIPQWTTACKESEKRCASRPSYPCIKKQKNSSFSSAPLESEKRSFSAGPYNNRMLSNNSDASEAEDTEYRPLFHMNAANDDSEIRDRSTVQKAVEEQERGLIKLIKSHFQDHLAVADEALSWRMRALKLDDELGKSKLSVKDVEAKYIKRIQELDNANRLIRRELKKLKEKQACTMELENIKSALRKEKLENIALKKSFKHSANADQQKVKTLKGELKTVKKLLREEKNRSSEGEPSMTVNLMGVEILRNPTTVEEIALTEKKLIELQSCLLQKREEINECAICRDKPRSHICVPCGHKVLCEDPQCHKGAEKSCPVCRQFVEMIMKVV